MPADALRMRGVTVSYGRTEVVSDVALEVPPGQVVGLLGPSGSGKSTLLAVAAGFVRPAAGEVWLSGRCVASPERCAPPERRDVAMVFQNHGLWPHLSALDTVAYPVRRRGASRARAREEAHALLELLHVAHLSGRRPAELSGGEQQRVGLARALARRASLYLFDEPTAHLDTALRAAFLEELADRQQEFGAAAVYATHDAQEALGLCDRVALLSGGRVLQVGTPDEVYHRPVDERAARLTGPVSVLTVAGERLLVRPEWASLDGDRAGTVQSVRFRGPHTDYLLATEAGPLLVRDLRPPRHRRGDRVGWSVRRSWPAEAPARPPGPGRVMPTRW